MVIVARLRKPHDGLFSGIIDALDTVNNTYRITFDRVGFGTYSVPDIDVVVRITSTADTLLAGFTGRLMNLINIISTLRFYLQSFSISYRPYQRLHVTVGDTFNNAKGHVCHPLFGKKAEFCHMIGLTVQHISLVI